MKKVILVLAVLSAAAAGYGHSGIEVRLSFDARSDFDMDVFSFESLVSKPFRGPVFWGGTLEVILDHTGFGISGLANVPITREEYATRPVYAWDGGLFLNHHIFGANSFLDPYVGIGFNCAGDVTVARSGSYGKANWGTRQQYSGSSRAVRLGLYPFLTGGLALNLDGLVLGAKFSAQPYRIDIPGLTPYRTPAYSVGLFAGVSFGGRK